MDGNERANQRILFALIGLIQFASVKSALSMPGRFTRAPRL
jgi:hypothetical protein